MSGGSGWFRIMESFAGAWQQNAEVKLADVRHHYAVFSCMTLIASDISKLPITYTELVSPGVWEPTFNTAYSPVLERQNTYQTRMQFWESWMLSKLGHGNTYVLLERNANGNVTGMHVLDPNRVQVLVSSDGEIFYQLSTDELSGIETASVTVPAREIIHDRWNCLYHPLVGISPICAAALAAQQSLDIQTQSVITFRNRGVPSGILTAPGSISNETAERLKAAWTTQYSGENAGKIAVLGDGLTFAALSANSRDAQLVEQLKWAGEVVCSVFHVPPYKIGLGVTPAYNNIQALNTEYYSQALQVLIEAAESLLDAALGLGRKQGTQFDLDNLLRMDTQSLVQTVKEGIAAGIYSPDEGRRKFGLPGVPGGTSTYMQAQMTSLAAIAARDAAAALPAPEPVEPTPEAAPAPLGATADDLAKMQAQIEQLRAALAAVPAPVDHTPDIAELRAALAAVPAPVDHTPDIAELRAALAAVPAPVDPTPLVGALRAEIEAVRSAIPDLAPVVSEARAASLAVAEIKHLSTVPDVVHALDKRLDKLEAFEPSALAIETLAVDIDDDRYLALTINGHTSRVKLHGLPHYVGVWRQGMHERGAMATFGGSVWSAVRDTESKPGGGSADWVLSVKRGQDARLPQTSQRAAIDLGNPRR
jgi:HK97 family phage portal protein